MQGQEKDSEGKGMGKVIYLLDSQSTKHWTNMQVYVYLLLALTRRIYVARDRCGSTCTREASITPHVRLLRVKRGECLFSGAQNHNRGVR